MSDLEQRPELPEEIKTTIPDANTNYADWEYENRKWIPAIGIQNMKSYFLSLIYTPYDAEMVDITSDFLEPEDETDSISLKTDAIYPSSFSSKEEGEFIPMNDSIRATIGEGLDQCKESDIMQLFSLLMQSAGAMKSNAKESEEEYEVSADMEVD
jgi:hypothetical protein